jgi:hypothetical protein
MCIQGIPKAALTENCDRLDPGFTINKDQQTPPVLEKANDGFDGITVRIKSQSLAAKL